MAIRDEALERAALTGMGYFVSLSMGDVKAEMARFKEQLNGFGVEQRPIGARSRRNYAVRRAP